MSSLPWIRQDVARSLTDVALDVSRHCADGTTPSAEQLRRWLQLLNATQRAVNQLETACETLVETGAHREWTTDLEHALASAQGNEHYVPRNLRW